MDWWQVGAIAAAILIAGFYVGNSVATLGTLSGGLQEITKRLDSIEDSLAHVSGNTWTIAESTWAISENKPVSTKKPEPGT